MNIFFLYFDPTECAQAHVDRHVVKMILETAQLLCSAHYATRSLYVPRYKLTHKNHPSSIWTRESLGNYVWLCELGLALCTEYTFRYGKVHKSEEVIRDLAEHFPPISDVGFTTPRLAMPDTYKHANPFTSYRHYYAVDKKRLHSWKKRPVPSWIDRDFDSYCHMHCCADCPRLHCIHTTNLTINAKIA